MTKTITKEDSLHFIDILGLHDYKMLVRQYHGIKSRCAHNKNYQGVEVQFSLIDFLNWVIKQGGRKVDQKGLSYEVCRISDRGNYSLDNIIYQSKADNLRQAADYYFITNTQTGQQIMLNQGLVSILKTIFGETCVCGSVAHSCKNTDRLYKGKYKIITLKL